MILADLITADIWAIGLTIVGFLLSLQGLWLVCRALWPNRVESAAMRCQRNAVACFFIGAVVTGVTIPLIGFLVGKFGAPGGLVGGLIAFMYLIFSGIGSAGFVTHIGRRLASPIDADRPWRATVRGGVTLELAALIPVLGWFGILPISMIIGAGAATLAMFTKSAARPGGAGTAQLPVPRPASWQAAPPPVQRGAMELPALEPEEALR
ncbi:MAG TPA: hypothetical protein VG269_25410 [Tepidisphaeraceae bacterium]|jgi:hypothetical protein|nr:hypothetical protein [Tepidisphaeraceae bacterium]